MSQNELTSLLSRIEAVSNRAEKLCEPRPMVYNGALSNGAISFLASTDAPDRAALPLDTHPLVKYFKSVAAEIGALGEHNLSEKFVKMLSFVSKLPDLASQKEYLYALKDLFRDYNALLRKYSDRLGDLLQRLDLQMEHIDLTTIPNIPDQNRITKVELWTGTLLDRMKLTFANSAAIEAGGPGGSHAVLNLSQGEYIVHIIYRQGAIVDSLKIITNLGRTISGGGMGGKEAQITVHDGGRQMILITAIHGATMKGGHFVGSFAAEVQELSFKWKCDF
jgi:hypothetical protein